MSETSGEIPNLNNLDEEQHLQLAIQAIQNSALGEDGLYRHINELEIY